VAGTSAWSMAQDESPWSTLGGGLTAPAMTKTRKLTKVWASRLRVQISPAVVGVAPVVPCPAGSYPWRA
jgi:hypothetical protein